MRVKDILGIVIGILAISTIVSMWYAMIYGGIDKGTEILSNSLIPWWINPLVILSASNVGITIVILIIIFKDKILDFKF
jgi:hypothetical protein